jgi:tetratricopeptide (TPR) repeat protein
MKPSAVFQPAHGHEEGTGQTINLLLTGRDIVLITHSDRPIQVVVIFRDMDRIGLLSEILSQHPNDAFARYGLAMEYSKAGEVERSLAEFNQLLSAHPDYTAGYFMAAQTLVQAGRSEEAKKMLAKGIASAQQTGNDHARAEMEALQTELG